MGHCCSVMETYLVPSLNVKPTHTCKLLLVNIQRSVKRQEKKQNSAQSKDTAVV